jgi:hypothetical protein
MLMLGAAVEPTGLMVCVRVSLLLPLLLLHPEAELLPLGLREALLQALAQPLLLLQALTLTQALALPVA